MKTLISAALVGALLAVAATPCAAFETPVHAAITAVAATSSLDDALVLRLGLNAQSFQDRFPSPIAEHLSPKEASLVPLCATRFPKTSVEHMQCGAMYEDLHVRSLNHFLDGQHVDPQGFGLPLPYLSSISAGEWALHEHPSYWQHDDTLQEHSYRNAEDKLFIALLGNAQSSPKDSQSLRQSFWGYFFRDLGQVVHLLEDMASPQHTRSEPHYDKAELLPLSEPSRFELRGLNAAALEWMKQCLVKRSSIDDCRHGSALAAQDTVFPKQAGLLYSARSFWENVNLTGLAQLTSRNFPTQLRNFTRNGDSSFSANADYPLPQPSGSREFLLGDIDKYPLEVPSAFLTKNCGSDLRNCSVTMISAQLADPFDQSVGLNEFASSYSMFDEDLMRYNRRLIPFLFPFVLGRFGPTYSTLAINRFNIDRAYQYLIPRALAYSTGFLNFYFRGKIRISPPQGGAYAIVDESQFSPADPANVAIGHRGFSKIRVALANTTSLADDGSHIEGAIDQPMTDGKLWLVLRYYRNKCFTDDFNTMATSEVNLDGCIDPTEEIVVSNPIDRTGKGRTVLPMPSPENPNGEELSFAFPNELPINAWNVLLQVVFRGTLGEEENKIAVSTIDISEPTFFSIHNNSDYVYLRGKCYTPQQVRADQSLWKLVSYTCMNPENPADILSDACYKTKFGLRLEDASSATPRFTILNEKAEDGDHRIPPGRFARFAALTDQEHGFDVRIKFRNPGFQIDEDLRTMRVVPYRAHRSRTIPGEQTHDIFVPQRSINTWDGVSMMFDAESGEIAKDADDACVAGVGDTLPALEGDARYPYPTSVTWVSN